MKKLTKQLLLFLTFVLFYSVHAQSPLQEGFGYLEKGDLVNGKAFFEKYLEKHPENKTAKLCYGRAVGLSGEPERAKKIFQELLDSDPKNIEYNINAAECLLWNSEFKVALVRYQELTQTFDPNPIIQLGLANTYSNLKNYKKAIHHYHEGLRLNPKVLGIYIGLAYTHVANNQNKKALETIDKALTIDPNHEQLSGLKRDIQNKFKPKFNQINSITFDSGDNQSINSNNEYIHPLSTKSMVGIFYNYRESVFLLTNNTSKQYNLGVKASHDVTNKINLLAEAGLLDINGENTYRDITYKVGAKIKLAYNQDLNIYYQKEYHNFNVQLINAEISQNHFFANYHILTKYKIGLFSQFYNTQQSDDNSRNLLFTSLYYLINNNPPIKVGFNSVIMGFEIERPTVYFSPKKYLVYEGFFDFSLFKSSSKWVTSGIVAFGFQVINEDQQQSFRAELNAGYKPNEQISAVCYGKYSNQAVGNAAGFEFNEIGIKFNYRF